MKYLLLFLAFITLLKPILPVLDYVANYDYISKNLCLNKKTPVMGCNGKCYLKSELAKSSENEKPISNNKKNALLESENLFFQEIAVLQINALFLIRTKKVTSNYCNLYFYSDCQSVFHPPATIS